MRLKDKQRVEIDTVYPFILREDTVLYEDTILGKYTTEMPKLPDINLKPKTRVMLTVTQPDTYILDKIKYTITFLITAGSTPIENARIVISGRDEFTDINGNAVFKLTKGTYTYTITHPSYDTVIDTITVTADDTEAVDIESDPIQALVNEYKAYVASQGGTIGVSDAALYSEYEAMVTAGEIQTDGTNLKIQHNFGMYGYKLSGSNVIVVYGLVKVGGNYPTYTRGEPYNYPVISEDALCFSDADGLNASITSADVPVTSLAASGGFNLEMNAKLIRGSADTLFIGAAGNIFNVRTRASGGMRTAVATPSTATVTSFDGYVTANFEKYRLQFVRAGGNLTLTYFKNDISINGGTVAWNFNGTGGVGIYSSQTTGVVKFKRFKIYDI